MTNLAEFVMAFQAFFVLLIVALAHEASETEGCSRKQVFVLDLIKVFVLDLN